MRVDGGRKTPLGLCLELEFNRKWKIGIWCRSQGSKLPFDNPINSTDSSMLIELLTGFRVQGECECEEHDDEGSSVSYFFGAGAECYSHILPLSLPPSFESSNIERSLC